MPKDIPSSPKVDIILPAVSGSPFSDQILDGLAPQAPFIQRLIIVEVHRCRSLFPEVLASSQCLLQHIIKKEEYFCRGINIVHLKLNAKVPPGSARNIGMSEVTAPYLAFIDSNTIPAKNWISSVIYLLHSGSCEVVIGTTSYHASSYLQKIIIAASYGFGTNPSLPGTILSVELLRKVGYFLPRFRSGEDIDFMARIREFSKSYVNEMRIVEPCKYTLQSSSILYYCYKWIRNYANCAPYRALYQQSFVLNLVLVGLLLAFGYNWNSLVAGKESSPLYLQNITKIIAAAISFAYIFSRSYILPFRRKSFSDGACNLCDVPLVFVFGFLLDFSKLIGFILRAKTILARKSL